MKILLIAVGSRGDVQPFVVLGRYLLGRGHDVHLAASSGFAEMIAGAGLIHHPLPLDFQELLQDRNMQAAMGSLAGKFRAYRHASDTMNDQLSAIWKIGTDLRPDLILHHFKAAPAANIAREIGATSIPVALQPGFAATREYPQFLIAKRSLGAVGNLASHQMIQWLMRSGAKMMIRRWRKQGGPDIGGFMNTLEGYSPDGNAHRIHAFSPALVPRPADWPDAEIQTGYLFADPVGYTPSPELSRFLNQGDRPIYVGFGSMPGINHQRVTKALLGALHQTGLRAVVATGWGGIGELGPRDDIHVLDAVPHSWLFPQVGAVVHHGGSGTTHEGLRWGCPTMVCPLFADQRFFGRRVADIGAGPTPIAQKRLTADNLAQALDTALSPKVINAATATGEAMKTEDGAAAIADFIEQLPIGAR